jgi:hypothetical protein
MGKDKQVALCFFGQMRTYEKCYDYLELNIIEKLNPDIFIHTWKEIGGTWKNLDNTPDKIITNDKLNRIYSPKEAVIESFDESNYWNLDDVRVPEKVKNLPNYQKGILPMFYKMKQVNNLRKEYSETNYDLVILLRSDFAVLDPIPKKIINNPDNLWVRPRPPYKIEDQIVIGAPKIIDYYTGIWQHLEEYWETELGEAYDMEDIATPEKVIHHHMNQSDINIKRYEIDGGIVRHDEDIDFIEDNLPKRIIHILISGEPDNIKRSVSRPEAGLVILRDEGLVNLSKKSIQWCRKNLGP